MRQDMNVLGETIGEEALKEFDIHIDALRTLTEDFIGFSSLPSWVSLSDYLR